MYIESSKIKAFPSAQRPDSADRESKLFIEQNLVTMVNRLTGSKSFVIDGLSYDGNSNSITAGCCSVYGYFFRFTNAVVLPRDLSINVGNVLAIKIRTKNVNGVEELINIDSTAGATDNTTYYQGVDIVSIPEANAVTTTNGNITTHYLVLCKRVDAANWRNVYADCDITDTVKKRLNTLIFDAESIQMCSPATQPVTSRKGKNSQDLSTYLTNNIVIDDGEV